MIASAGGCRAQEARPTYNPVMTDHRPHVVLLGDSIFDNSAYTNGAPDVVTHLRGLIPKGWRATSCAVDGATTAGLAAQLGRVPADASHLVIAIGGNDALQNSDLLALRVTSSAQALEIFADRIATFERAYRAAIRKALALERPTAICTVYNGALEAERATVARVGLALFNDVILRTAIDLRLDALELRSICTDPGDYANPIEPSGAGGLKIAHAVARLVGAVDADTAPARIWGQC
jgi:lysophospholipase L1-like esterase